MSRLLKRYERELTAGVTPSLPELKSPFFTSANGFHFSADGARVVPQWVKIASTTTDNPVRGMFAATLAGVSWLFFGTANMVWRWNVGFDKVAEMGFAAPLTGGLVRATADSEATRWSFARIGNIVLASDGVRGFYDSVSGVDFADIVGTEVPDFAEIVRSYGSRVVAFNTDEGEQVIQWPDLGDYTDWAPTSGNNAGKFEVNDAPGAIVAAEPIGQSGILFYTQGSTHIFYAIPTSLVFAHRQLSSAYGAAGKFAVVPVGNKHYVFGPTGIFTTDGVTFQQLDDPVIRRYIYRNLDTAQLGSVQGWHNTEFTEVQFAFKLNGLNDVQGVGYNYMTGAWSLYGGEFTSALPRGVFNSPLAGTFQGQIYGQNPDSLGGAGDISGSSLSLTPDAVINQGYGTLGFGEWGYGGKVLNG